jgi:hypothetical protein
LFFYKNGLLKVFHPLKIYHNTKFRGPTFTDASFASTSKSLNIRHFGMVEATALKTMASKSPSMA